MKLKRLLPCGLNFNLVIPSLLPVVQAARESAQSEAQGAQYNLQQ